MPRSAKSTLIFLGLGVAVAATLAAYGLWVWSWMAPPIAAPAAPAKNLPRQTEALLSARLRLRDRFLDVHNHLRLAEALYRQGSPVDAFYVMANARSFFGEEEFLRSHSFVTLYRESHFLAGGQFEASAASEERLKLRLRDDPDNPGTLIYLAHLANLRGDPKEAQRLADHGLAANPDHPGLLAARAKFSSQEDSLKFLARLAAFQRDTFEGRSALDELGRIAQGRDEGGKTEPALLARETLEELYRKFPQDPRIFSTLAMSTWGRGDIPAVRSLAAQALSRRPENPGAYQVQGTLDLLDKRPENAIRSFTAAWEKNSEDLYSAEKLAQLYDKQRADSEAALPYYIALYRMNPRYEDSEPLEIRIRRILDIRREQLLREVNADRLPRFLRSEDASLRAQACVRAAELGDPRFIEALGELLDDDAEIVRHNADYALFKLSGSNADNLLMRRLEWINSPKPLVRARALNLFADMDPKDTLPLASRALYDPNPAVRLLVRLLVFDHYYRNAPQARQTAEESLRQEKDPVVLALYQRFAQALPPLETPAPRPRGRRGRR